MRHNCSQQHQSIPKRECWALKTLHLKLDFFLAKLAFGQRTTASASITDKMHGAWTGQAGYKRKDCQTLPRQGKTVLKNFLPLKKPSYSSP